MPMEDIFTGPPGSDAVHAALAAMIPDGIREAIGPAETRFRVLAAAQLMAGAELRGIDKQHALHQARKILETLPLATWFTVAGALARMAGISTDPDEKRGMLDDLATLTDGFPAAGALMGADDNTRAFVLAEIGISAGLSGPAHGAGTERRRIRFRLRAGRFPSGLVRKFKWKFWSRND